MSKLSNELIELSTAVEKHNRLYTTSNIIASIELGGEISLPLYFRARVLEPGTYKGVTFKKEDIIKNMNSIFKVVGNVANNELNKDHKNNRKDSSVTDLLGRVSAVEYDEHEDALYMDCEVTDRNMAEKIALGTYKFVSLRIMPFTFDFDEGFKIARDFDFEELSIVRQPGYDNARITSIQS